MKTKFTTGQAGTGKTYQLKQQLLTDPGMVMAATTGIAAMNLGEGIVTINSLLKYFNYEDLNQKFNEGIVKKRLTQLVEKEGLRTLAVDEVSMLDGRMNPILVDTFREVEEETGKELELIYTGDFCQLPPVKAPFAFECEEWERFADNTEKLTKVWRQSDEKFMAALNAIRRGNGMSGAAILRELPVEWATTADEDFDGTTIMSRNDMVDSYNLRRLAQLPGSAQQITSFRWGLTKELKDNFLSVPESVMVKPGALVMLLANDTWEWQYANGTLGHIQEFDQEEQKWKITDLKGKELKVGMVTRLVHSKEIPPQYKDSGEDSWPRSAKEARDNGHGYDWRWWDEDKQKWVIAECRFFPFKLAWATTVHKSQGLSLDRVQIDLEPGKNWAFIGNPAMCYVSLSRARTPEGIRIVGSPALLGKRTKIDPKITPWL